MNTINESYLDDLKYIGDILNKHKISKELDVVIHSYKEKKNEIESKQLPWKH